ncbi:hypothetical protein [Aquimarina aggregata]|uniref:hypothetical protein n=1 Tax=Aquimarina aggregata TaxID=1642818 RepID=UPI0024932990|nr:hypothetical protein [Aquimarina aggregata]
MNIEKASIREKQTIGALCILSFCEKYNINYKGIDELINHLLELLVSKNLPDWNQKGLNIEVVGRGDNLPVALKNLIPENLFEDFYRLIDNTIEIGIVDLFGETTDYPKTFLYNCIDILNKHSIKLEIPEILLQGNYKHNTWGEPWSTVKYEELKNILF